MAAHSLKFSRQLDEGLVGVIRTYRVDEAPLNVGLFLTLQSLVDGRAQILDIV